MVQGSMFKVQCERDRPFSLSFEPETVNFRVLARDGLASQAPMRNSSTRSNWMPDQEILQRGKPTGAIPKGHMLYVRNQKHFAAGRQLGQTLRGSHRCATAPAHIIVSATENERRNCYLGSLRESVPSKTRILVTAKDFHRALSRPDGIGQGHHHVAMFAIKVRVKCHGIVFDVGANVTLKPRVANFSFGISRDIPGSATKRSCSGTRGGDGDRYDQTRPRDGHRLHNLTAESETHRMAPGDS